MNSQTNNFADAKQSNNDNVTNIKTRKRIIINFLSILIIMRATLGIALLIPIYTTSVYIVLYVVWLCYACLNKKDYANSLIINAGWMIVFLSINIVFDLLFSSQITTEIKTYVYIYFIYSVFLYYRDNYQTFKIITMLILGTDLVVICINTIIQLEINPLISRDFTSSSAGYEGASNMIGSFWFIYATMYLGIFLITSLRNYNIRTKGLVIIYLALYSLLLFQASFFIALFIFLVCIIWARVQSENTAIIRLLISLVIVIITLILIPILPTLFYQLSGLEIFNNIISMKLYDIGYAMEYGFANSSTSAGRLLYMRQSVETFYENFFLGTHSTWKTNYIIGNHCGWFDELARFGILRYLPFLIFIYNAYKRVIKSIDKSNHVAFKSAVLAFVLVGFLNQHISSITGVVFFIGMPFMCAIGTNSVIIKHKGIRNN
jgi:hypothetical protein